MNYNILVVDDEKELADVIELYLAGESLLSRHYAHGKVRGFG